MSNQQGPLQQGVFSGQCRIETVPAQDGGLQLEGLRLSLDLRLPSSASETEGVPPARDRCFRRGWLLGGACGLLLAVPLLVLRGWWQAGSPSSGAPAALSSAPPLQGAAPALPASRPLPPPAAFPAPRPPLAPSEPLAGAAGAAPAPALASSSAPAARGPSIRPLAEAAPRAAARTERTLPHAALPATQRQAPLASSGGGSPLQAEPRATTKDSLELFGDTK